MEGILLKLTDSEAVNIAAIQHVEIDFHGAVFVTHRYDSQAVEVAPQYAAAFISLFNLKKPE